MSLIRITLLCALTLLVVTCGQKGPLYLPDQDAVDSALSNDVFVE